MENEGNKGVKEAAMEMQVVSLTWKQTLDDWAGLINII